MSGEGKRGKAMAVLIGAILLIAAGVAAWFMLRPAPQPVQPIAAIVPRPKVEAPAFNPDSPEMLTAAFQSATGHKAAYAGEIDGQPATTSPLKLLVLPFGPVLLTKTEQEDGCHACTGAIGVYYLSRKGDGFAVAKKWPAAISGWGWGAAPTDWSVTEKFTAYPAIYAEGGFTAQGYTCGGATITELRPEGPVGSDMVALSYTNGGAVLDNGVTMGGEPERNLDGKIENIVKDKGFDVVVPDESIRESYVRKGGKFVPVKPDSQLSC